MPSMAPSRADFSTQRSINASASAVNVARICITAFGLRMRDSTVRVCVCSGGSASRIRLRCRNGVSRLKLVKPTPALEMKLVASFSTACTSACRAHATSPS